MANELRNPAQDPEIPEVLRERGEEIWKKLSDVLAEYDLEGYELSEVKLVEQQRFICFDCCPFRIYLC